MARATGRATGHRDRGRILTLALIGVLLSGTVAPAQTGGTQAVPELSYGGGGAYTNPQPDVIVAVLDRLLGRQDDFAVLSRGPDDYMQTIGGPDDFRLEVRDGGPDRHFGCSATREQIDRAFLSYAAPDDDAGARSAAGSR